MDLRQLMTPHSTVLTPNRRLAATLRKQHDETRSTEHTSWASLDILPLTSWIQRLWQTYCLDHFSDTPLLLKKTHELILWENIIRTSKQNDFLLQITKTAELAHSAWGIIKQWRLPLEDSRLITTEDGQAFQQWAKTFTQQCQKNNWLANDSLIDFITDKVLGDKIHLPERIILVGFTEMSPQHHFLFNQCGDRIIHYTAPDKNTSCHAIALATEDDELYTMARWAKAKLPARNNAIGCIIPNLDMLRDKVERIFSAVLCDKSQFNLSAGKSLLHYPLMQTAWQLLQLNKNAIHLDALIALLHSPFVGDAESERIKRANFTYVLRKTNQLIFSHDHLVKLSIDRLCPLFASLLQNNSKQSAASEKKPISEWMIHINEKLIAFGWPGERSLSSVEYQIVQCLLELLTELSSYDCFLSPLSYQQAIHILNTAASKTIFQAKTPDAPIQLLGLLEAADIPFDDAWVMGMDDTRWPPQPKPNPFIPTQLQKCLNMPHASAERELAYCKKLLSQFTHSTKTMILSYPTQNESGELRISPLLENIPLLKTEQLALADYVSLTELIYQSRLMEEMVDDIAPAIASDTTIEGGTHIVKQQALCPFKAFADIRLHTRQIDETRLGLRPQDRGKIVHKALELIWRDLVHSETLQQTPADTLLALVQDKIILALEEITKEIIANSRYLTIEAERLTTLLLNWLRFEMTRPAFSVFAQEQKQTLQIDNLTLDMQIDRIDQLADGTHLIIDYKTGKHLSIRDWFGSRPSEPQLPLYLLSHIDKTIGIAFAQIHLDKIELKGISKHDIAIDTIQPIIEVAYAELRNFDQQIAEWTTQLTKLSRDFLQGVATVDPKEAEATCQYCQLQPLCRIYE